MAASEAKPTLGDEAVPTPDAATVAAYEATHYYAHAAERVLLRVGDPPEKHAGFLDSSGATSATILTAWNPLGQDQPEAENRRAQEALLSAIRARALRWLNATGEDPTGAWEPEPGFCVLDLPDAVLDEWLVIFRQNAAVRAARGEPCRLVWHPAIRSRPDATR
jgi:hypothetical protein